MVSATAMPGRFHLVFHGQLFVDVFTYLLQSASEKPRRRRRDNVRKLGD